MQAIVSDSPDSGVTCLLCLCLVLNDLIHSVLIVYTHIHDAGQVNELWNQWLN